MYLRVSCFNAFIRSVATLSTLFKSRSVSALGEEKSSFFFYLYMRYVFSDYNLKQVSRDLFTTLGIQSSIAMKTLSANN